MPKKTQAKSKKNVALKIEDRMFHFDIHVWHGDKDLFTAWATEAFSLTQNDVRAITEMNSVGQFIPMHNGNVMLYITDALEDAADPMAILTIAHECQHAAFFVLAQRGLEYCDGSEEAFTYYASWLAERVLERLGVLNAK